MAVKTSSTIEPYNNSYFVANAEHIGHNGKPLPKFLPVPVTQAEYDAMVEAGTVDEDTMYFIKEEPL